VRFDNSGLLCCRCCFNNGLTRSIRFFSGSLFCRSFFSNSFLCCFLYRFFFASIFGNFFRRCFFSGLLHWLWFFWLHITLKTIALCTRTYTISLLINDG